MRINLEPAFVLHTKAYGNTSLIVDIFTKQHGRLALIAKSARGPKSRFRGLLQPFVPLLISWAGKSELVTLTNMEIAKASYNFTGTSLISALYINELLVRLLHRHDPHLDLYFAYEEVLTGLQHESHELSLRLFEKRLLSSLGYGLHFDQDIAGQPILAELHYGFDPHRGFYPQAKEPNNPKRLFTGKMLLALHNENLSSILDLTAIKRLMRMAINSLLGDRTIKTRELLPILPST